MLKHIFLMAEPGRDSYKREKVNGNRRFWGTGEPPMLKSVNGSSEKKLNVERGRKSGYMRTQERRHLEGGGSMAPPKKKLLRISLQK